MNDFNKQLLLLQINDAVFPIGGYSHSYGLETYIQKNIVFNGETVEEYIKSKILYSLTYTELLGARLAYEYAQEENLDEILLIDEIFTAAKAPKEIRQASVKLGSRFLKTVSNFDINAEFFCKYSNFKCIKHHATAYGVLCGSLNIDKREMLKCYIYNQTSAMITTAVKTVPLSQSEGQKILFFLGDTMEQALNTALNCKKELLCASAPAFDVRCMEHERLYSRLYMS